LFFKKLLRLWPLCIPPILFWIRPDTVIFTLIKYFEVESRLVLFLVASLAQLSSFLIWYGFFDWVIKSKLDIFVGISGSKIASSPEVIGAIKLGRETASEVRQKGIWQDILEIYEEVKLIVIEQYIWVRDPENSIVRKFKKGGYAAAFLAGLNPAGSRTICIACCRTVRSGRAFVFMVLGGSLWCLLSSFLWTWILD